MLHEQSTICSLRISGIVVLKCKKVRSLEKPRARETLVFAIRQMDSYVEVVLHVSVQGWAVTLWLC